MLRLPQDKVASFKRHQDEEEMKERRRTGQIIDIPTEYGIGLPMVSLEEVAKFVDKLNENTLRDHENKLRNRKFEIVSHINY